MRSIVAKLGSGLRLAFSRAERAKKQVFPALRLVEKMDCSGASRPNNLSLSQSLGLVLVLLLLWNLAGAASLAAEPPAVDPSPGPAGHTMGADAISSEKVSQFVQAYLKVTTLIDQQEGTLQGAQTESESLRVQEETRAAAVQMIEATGLTLQEYLQLLNLANIDPEFSERIAAQLQEANL